MRSVVAIVAGIFTMTLFGLGIDFAMMSVFPGAHDANGATQDRNVLVLTVLSAVVAHAMGAYVTALMARGAETRHALILGCTLLVISVPVTITRWGHAPAWYHIVLLASVLPATYLGGMLRVWQKGTRS